MGLVDAPIVRMTAEQLEYLIASIARKLRNGGDQGKWTYTQHDFLFGVGSQPGLLAKATNRLAIIWSNNSVNSFTVTTNPVPASNQGWQLNQQSPILVMRFDEYGWIVTESWGAFINSAGTAFSAIEILAPYNLRG